MKRIHLFIDARLNEHLESISRKGLGHPSKGMVLRALAHLAIIEYAGLQGFKAKIDIKWFYKEMRKLKKNAKNTDSSVKQIMQDIEFEAHKAIEYRVTKNLAIKA